MQAPPDAAKPKPRRRVRRALMFSGIAAAALVLLLALLVFGGWQALRTETGTAWLLSQVRGLKIVDGHGSLEGGPFSASHVEFALAGSSTRVVVEDLAWRDLHWTWRPHAGAWGGLVVDGLKARRLEVHSGGGGGSGPAQVPRSLTLPFELALADATIGELQVNELPPLRDVAASLHLSDERGSVHRVQRLDFSWDRLRARLQGSIGTSGAMNVALQAKLQAQPLTGAQGALGAQWQAEVKAEGPLQRLALDTSLRSSTTAALDLHAVVAPFAAWPLAQLDAQLRQLDLSTLAGALPATRLDGHAVLRSSGLDKPADVDVQLANSQPGRWDQGRLPVLSLEARLRATPKDRETLEFQQLHLVAGAAVGHPAGQADAQGRWHAGGLALKAHIEGLQPSALDDRLADMQVSGPLELQFSGGAADWRAELQAQLSGRLRAAGTPGVSLQLEGSARQAASTLSVELRSLQARAGDARAQAQAKAQRDGQGRWHLAGAGTLQQFDPLPWWPGPEGSAWRQGGHRIDGRFDLDIGFGAAPSGAALLRSLTGRANALLGDSRLAGVPLQGQLALQAEPGGAAAVKGELRAAGNSLAVDGRVALSDNGGADRWQAQLQAPQAAALAPLARLLPSLAHWQPLAGSLNGQLQVQGRWPAMASQGELSASGLKAGDLSLPQASARWRFGPTVDAPLELQASAEGAALGVQKLDHLRVQASGTLRQHHLRWQADTSARPPAWTEALIGSAGRGTTTQAEVEGRWQPTSEGGRWQAHATRLFAAPLGTPAPPAWLAADGLQLELGFGAGGVLQQVSAEPGRLSLLGAQLRWQQMRWQAGSAGTPARMDVQAQLDPMRVAPLLSRLQPDFGWGGDLAVAGHVVLATGNSFRADVVIERSQGDLSVTDEGGTQTLGLTDLRLGLAASDGVWHFTEALAGRTVGVLAGAQSLRVGPRAVWPDPRTPMEGVLELRVDNLGVWGPWTPPGWRLAGTLHTSATLGGRFDAPEYTGRLEGHGIGVRNLLLGVNVTEGEVAVALKGPTAQIERLTLKGGEGLLRAEGGATFGDQPQARLALTAEHFQLLGRVDRRIVASGRAELQLLPDALKLDGRFAVDEGLVDFSRSSAPSLDDDVSVVRRPGPSPQEVQAAATANATARPARSTQMALVVDLGERLRIRGRGLDTTLRGELRMSTPGGHLAVNGTVRSEAGHYQAYGQKLDIERGLLEFVGPVENPRLDIVALRPNLDVRVGVTVGGTALKPRVRLFSEPEMSDNDKLSWLVLGRAPEGLGRTDTALLQRAAMALLAGEGESATDKVLHTFGLDDFSVRSEGEGDVRNTIVSLGKQISRRWYLGYERGVNSTTGTWQAIYRIAQRFTLRAQAGEDNAVDVIWTWRWN